MNTHSRKYNWTIFEDENKKDDQESGGEKEILEKKGKNQSRDSIEIS